MDNRKEAIDYIIRNILEGRRDIHKIKREASSKFSVGMIKNSEILEESKGRIPEETADILRKKPVRTMSGVTPVAIMIRPENSCSHNCIYCPFTGRAAKSYTGNEPAAMRARQADFQPDRQVNLRLRQYRETGHPTDKCEIIIMGGTFLEMPERYKRDFIKRIYDELSGSASGTLEEALIKNESAERRAIGLTIETRPDVCGNEQINEVLGYGATRIELGVQHPDDDIYEKIKRGHKTEDVVRATALLKNSAFKVLYHLMPGIPGSNPEKDIGMIKKVFEDSDFRPDMLKIYPTLVMEDTELYEIMERGEYEPYSSEQAADVIAEFFRHIPKYVRVMRIQRDIPANLIFSGVRKSNLRELVHDRIREKGIEPKEIRWREVKRKGFDLREFSVKRMDYDASNGEESAVDEITGDCALIRELHVYGTEARIGRDGSIQHRGIGKKLLDEAEGIAKESGRKRMVVISGVGAREYYFRQGYERFGRYVAKKLL
jgi:elongator complex protein 3